METTATAPNNESINRRPRCIYTLPARRMPVTNTITMFDLAHSGGFSGDPRMATRKKLLLHELFHQADQVIGVEGAGSVCARVEKPPQLARLLDGIEQQLFFDEVFLQQLLIEAAHRSGQNIGHPKILCGDQ